MPDGLPAGYAESSATPQAFRPCQVGPVLVPLKCSESRTLAPVHSSSPTPPGAAPAVNATFLTYDKQKTPPILPETTLEGKVFCPPQGPRRRQQGSGPGKRFKGFPACRSPCLASPLWPDRPDRGPRGKLGDVGTMVASDRLSSYDPPPCAEHRCIARHLRAITATAFKMTP
jgi:hypothetical protein